MTKNALNSKEKCFILVSLYLFIHQDYITEKQSDIGYPWKNKTENNKESNIERAKLKCLYLDRGFLLFDVGVMSGLLVVLTRRLEQKLLRLFSDLKKVK